MKMNLLPMASWKMTLYEGGMRAPGSIPSAIGLPVVFISTVSRGGRAYYSTYYFVLQAGFALRQLIHPWACERRCRPWLGFIHSPLLPTSVRGTVSMKLLHVSDWRVPYPPRDWD